MHVPTQLFPPWKTLASLHAIVAMWEFLAETPERDSEFEDGELQVAHASDARWHMEREVDLAKAHRALVPGSGAQAKAEAPHWLRPYLKKMAEHS